MLPLRPLKLYVLLLASLLLAPPAFATATIDFEGQLNGEQGPFSYVFPTETVSVYADVPPPGNHLGTAIFDGSFGGPNDVGGPDNDLDLVIGSGNILILQNNNFPTQTVPGIYDTANDDEQGGIFYLDFSNPVYMESIDLIDINGGGMLTVTLTDTSSFSRTYSVPDEWTGDITQGYQGWETLDLTSVLPQVGIGLGTPSTSVVEDVAFDEWDVVQVEIAFNGSAGLDNVSFIPEPTTALLVGLGLSVLALRRKTA